MTETPLRLIRRCAEYRPIEEVDGIPAHIRGIYVLLKRKKGSRARYNVVYIGMTTRGVKARLRAHRRTKTDLWDHFSIYEVYENVRDQEIIELEGIFRHVFRRDERASRLNVARSYKKLSSVRNNNLDEWPEG